MSDSDAGSDAPQRGAFLVASGIFLSRIFGVVRNQVLARLLGRGDAADVLAVAMRLPNVLQNLLGEGVLSASFIPVYSSLLARGDKKEADRLAGALFAVLALLLSVLVLAGVLFAPVLVTIFTPAYSGEKRELLITAVRVFFPGTGLLVLSAWCLGVLNSHGRFFLSYSAPVVWNLSIIGFALANARSTPAELVVWVAIGAVAGSLAQLSVQLPAVLSLTGRLSLRLSGTGELLAPVRRAFAPVLLGRGVVNVSGYVDIFLVGLLGTGAAAAFVWAQTLYILPISLFGMSVSAAELPALSSQADPEHGVAGMERLRARIGGALQRIAYLIVPSAIAYLVFGGLIVGTLFQGGRFEAGDTVLVALVLATFALGLVPATLSRLLSSGFYALRDTRTPMNFAIARVVLGTLLAVMLILMTGAILNGNPGANAGGVLLADARVAGVSLAASIASWLEFLLLYSALERRIGKPAVSSGYFFRVVLAGIAGGVPAVLAMRLLQLPVPLELVICLGAYGLLYMALCWWWGIMSPRDISGVLFRR